MNFKIIAIDGPTGVGKSTIARRLAEKSDCLYVDTGAMFRCLAWCWGKQGCPEDEDSLLKLGKTTRIVFKIESVFCNEIDVTQAIRSEAISALASKISKFPLVREVMKQQQRKLVEEARTSGSFAGAVLEGRDIGTVVFPDAEYKFYVDASPEVRAQRRTSQLQEQGESADYQEILKALRERDFQDKNREVAPLQAAENALKVDTGNLSVAEVLEVLAGSVCENEAVTQNDIKV